MGHMAAVYMKHEVLNLRNLSLTDGRRWWVFRYSIPVSAMLAAR